MGALIGLSCGGVAVTVLIACLFYCFAGSCERVRVSPVPSSRNHGVVNVTFRRTKGPAPTSPLPPSSQMPTSIRGIRLRSPLQVYPHPRHRPRSFPENGMIIAWGKFRNTRRVVLMIAKYAEKECKSIAGDRIRTWAKKIFDQ